MTGRRGPTSKPAAERRLAGNAGKRDPKTTAPDPGDRTLRVPGLGPAHAHEVFELPTSARSPARRAPRVPAWLKPEAKAEWSRIVPALKQAGYIENTDTALLAMYCSAWADWRELDEEIRATDAHIVHCPECSTPVIVSHYLVSGARDNAVKTPLWQMRRDAAGSLERLGSALGLAPAARQRMPPPRSKGSDAADPLNDLGGAAAEPDDELEEDEE